MPIWRGSGAVAAVNTGDDRDCHHAEVGCATSSAPSVERAEPNLLRRERHRELLDSAAPTWRVAGCRRVSCGGARRGLAVRTFGGDARDPHASSRTADRRVGGVAADRRRSPRRSTPHRRVRPELDRDDFAAVTVGGHAAHRRLPNAECCHSSALAAAASSSNNGSSSGSRALASSTARRRHTGCSWISSNG